MLASKLYKPTVAGSIKMANALVMAPMTRSRADPVHHMPNDLMAEFYAQRADAGLLIAEATPVSRNCSAFFAEPGLYEDAQIAGWKKFTSAVHAKGGKIALQLWHGGAVCPAAYNNGAVAVAASGDTPMAGAFYNALEDSKPTPYDTNLHELTDLEVVRIVDDFSAAASRAIEAGFDGIEIHAANGYLINQFLVSTMNKRSGGKYSGKSIETRSQFLFDIVDACVDAIGKDKVGVRLSPYVHYNSAKWDNPNADIPHVASQLSKRNIAFLHAMRRNMMSTEDMDVDVTGLFRKHFDGFLMSNIGFERAEAERFVDEGLCDAVAVGSPFLSNPDLVTRFHKKLDDQRNPMDTMTVYGGGARGYTDYPTL